MMSSIVVVIAFISSCYIWFNIGYRKGRSDGIDEVLQTFDETMERMVKDDQDCQ